MHMIIYVFDNYIYILQNIYVTVKKMNIFQVIEGMVWI